MLVFENEEKKTVFELSLVFNKGFSLLEIIVATTLGLLLLSGVVEFYISFKSTYKTQQEIVDIQEKGRLATHIFRKNIGMAGYFGCNTNSFSGGIRGYVSSNVPKYLRNKAVSGSDVIVVKEAAENIVHLTVNTFKSTKIIYVTKNPATESRPYLWISDCKHSDLIRAINYGGNTIRLDRPIGWGYKKSSTEVAQFANTTYFIGETTRKNKSGKYMNALYYSVNEKRKEELIEGIKK